MNMNRQIKLIVVLILGVLMRPTKSSSFTLLMNYIRCTESNSVILPSDATIRRRLAGFNTLEKSLSYYQIIYTDYNKTTSSALRKCMGEDFYQDGHLFLNQDFFGSFTTAVKDMKAQFELLPLNEIGDTMIFYFEILHLTHPFYVDYVLKYEHSFVMFHYYEETIPCGESLRRNAFKKSWKSNTTRLLKFESNCTQVDVDSASSQHIEDYIKCELRELSQVCVKPTLKFIATVLAARYPQIIKGDLYSYAISLTNNLFPDPNSSSGTSFASVYFIVFLVTLFSYINIF